MRDMSHHASSLTENVWTVRQHHISAPQLLPERHQEHQVLHQTQQDPVQQEMTVLAVMIGIVGNVDDARVSQHVQLLCPSKIPRSFGRSMKEKQLKGKLMHQLTLGVFQHSHDKGRPPQPPLSLHHIQS